MANTFSILDFNNTFGDWFVATNNLTKENNDLAANNYVKSTGTLFLNEPGLSLQTSNSAIIGGALQVQGTGSSAYIQNNLRVDGQVYFTNTVLGLTNTGQANIGGPLLALGSGYGLQVSNDALVNNSLSVLNNETIGNNLTVVANTTSNNLSVVYQTITKTLLVDTTARVNDSIFITNSAFANYIQANSSIATINTLSSFGVTTAYLQANSAVNTMVLTTNTINCLNNAYVNILQANTSVNTAFLTVSANANLASLIVTDNATFVTKANTVNDLGVGTNLYVYGNEAITGTLNVTDKTTLIASSNTTNDLGVGTNLYVTGNEVVTGTTTLTGKANTVNDLGVGTNLYVTGNQVVTGTSVHTGKTTLVAASNTTNDLGIGTNLYVAGNEVVTGNKTVIGVTTLTSKANALADFGVSGNQYVTGVSVHTGKTTLVASSNTTNDLGIGGSLYAPRIVIPSGGNIVGDYAQFTANSIAVGSGGLSVQGNFTINGTTVYNTPEFVISAGTPNPSYGKFGVFRNSNGSSNTFIRWNESQKYWDLTANSATEPYYRILTDQYINNTGTLNSSTNVASSMALYVANTFLQTVISNANTQLKSYTDGQLSYVSGVDATQNTRLSTVEANTIYLFGALNQTNTNIVTANTQLKSYVDGQITSANTQLKAYTDGQVNSILTYNAGIETSQNTRLSTVEANTIYLFGALNQTNTNIVTANTQLKSYVDGQISLSYTYNNGVNAAQNTNITSANTQLKAYTDGAIASANTQLKSYTDGQITNVYNYYNGIESAQNTAIISANTQLKSYTDGYISYINSVNNAQNTAIISANTQLKSYTDGQFTNGTTNAFFNTIGIGVSPDTANVGSIVTTGDITSYYSDENLKNKLGNIENALDKVMSINGFYYEANEIAQGLGYKVKREVGVSAQEVQKVLPEVVVPAPIDDQYLTVHYERIIPLLIESIKELKKELDDLKKN